MNTRGTLTTTVVAALCQVSRGTVVKWLDTGLLASYRLPPTNKHRRVRVKDLERFAKKYGLPLEPPLKLFIGD